MNGKGHSDETSDGNEQGPGNWSILVILRQRLGLNCVMLQGSAEVELSVMMAHASREAFKVLHGSFQLPTVKCEREVFRDGIDHQKETRTLRFKGLSGWPCGENENTCSGEENQGCGLATI